MGTIDRLKSVVSRSGGFQHANYFNFSCPARGLIGSQVEYTITSATFPSRTIATAEHNPGTITKKFPYTIMDEDIEIVFRLTNDWRVYDIWLDWMESIISAENYTANYKNEYKADAYLSSMDKKLYYTKEFKLLNAYPIKLGDMQFSNESENTIATFGVSLTFDYFEITY